MRSETEVCIREQFLCKYNAMKVVKRCPDGLKFVNCRDEDRGGGDDRDAPKDGSWSGSNEMAGIREVGKRDVMEREAGSASRLIDRFLDGPRKEKAQRSG